MHDLIIIGAGPAGMTAAIYAARKKLDMVIISPDVGGQIAWTLEVDNYLGFNMISGIDLSEKFEQHIRDFHVEVINDTVDKLETRDGTFLARTRGGKEYESRTVIVASGRSARNLGVPGEEEFKGRDVAYCATCDAPLFGDEDVAVVGGGNAGMGAVVQLIKIAKQIYLIEERPTLTGNAHFMTYIDHAPNVRVLTGKKVEKIFGEKMVTGISIKDVDNGEREDIPVAGVFVEIGSLPNTSFLPVDLKLTPYVGEIEIDCANRTSIPGLFAAGDATTVPHKQIIIAAGEGAKAMLTAYDYLIRNFPDRLISDE